MRQQRNREGKPKALPPFSRLPPVDASRSKPVTSKGRHLLPLRSLCVPVLEIFA